MIKCAWCNSKALIKEGDKPLSNDVRVCPDCMGKNSFVAVSYEMDESGLASVMVPKAWCPTGEGLPGELQPRKWKTESEGARELNNLLAGRTRR